MRFRIRRDVNFPNFIDHRQGKELHEEIQVPGRGVGIHQTFDKVEFMLRVRRVRKKSRFERMDRGDPRVIPYPDNGVQRDPIASSFENKIFGFPYAIPDPRRILRGDISVKERGIPKIFSREQLGA